MLVPGWKFGVERALDYILRDWDIDGQPDRSINYCGDPLFEPFEVKYFKSGTLTPNKPNDCAAGSFLLTDLVERVEHPTSSDATAMQQAACTQIDIDEEVNEAAAAEFDLDGDILVQEPCTSSTGAQSEMLAAYSCSASYSQGASWAITAQLVLCTCID